MVCGSRTIRRKRSRQSSTKVSIHWPIATGLSVKEIPRRPDSPCAYVAMLHGNQEMFFIYALHLGHQLQATGSCEPFGADGRAADKVLLLGPSRFSDKASRAALYAAGWSHICSVNLIYGPHLSSARRHESVFTKLQMFGLPYKHLLFLDLDLHVHKDLRTLFSLPGPAGKCHFRANMPRDICHGQAVEEAFDSQELCQGSWCPNAGVLRVDPETNLARRRRHVKAMEQEISHFDVDSTGDLWPTMLPEQDYLAQRISGWRHISRNYNLELMEAQNVDELLAASVLHFSSKQLCSQPIIWLDRDISDYGATGEIYEWCRTFLQDHAFRPAVFAHACMQWREGFEDLRRASEVWPGGARRVFEDAIQVLTMSAPVERSWIEHERAPQSKQRWSHERGSRSLMLVEPANICGQCSISGAELFQGQGSWRGRSYCQPCWGQWFPSSASATAVTEGYDACQAGS